MSFKFIFCRFHKHLFHGGLKSFSAIAGRSILFVIPDQKNWKKWSGREPLIYICIYNAMISEKKGEAKTGQSNRGALPASNEYPQGYQSPVRRVDTHCLALSSPVCVWQGTIPPSLDSIVVRRKENTQFGDAHICGGAFEAVLPCASSKCQAGL
jgi:hypothetical protein